MIKIIKPEAENSNAFGKLSEKFVRYAIDKELNGGVEDSTEIFSYIDKMLEEYYEFSSSEEFNKMRDIFFGIYTGVKLTHAKYHRALKDNWDIIKNSVEKNNK